ncbi:hypothetical protein ACF0H5_023098 [Mactra antiquata]
MSEEANESSRSLDESSRPLDESSRSLDESSRSSDERSTCFVPPAPPLPPPPKVYNLPPEILEDDEFAEKRFQKELQFRIVGAIEKSNCQLLEDLINKGVNTNAKILLVKTPLIHALEQNEVCFDIVQKILHAKGTDPNLGDFTPWGMCPLHIIAKIGDIPLAKLFLESDIEIKCDINIKDKGGATPLQFAARYGQEEIVKYLIKKSADQCIKDSCGRTALHRACERQHLNIAQYLIDYGSDVNAVDKFGWSPLFHSVFFSDIVVMQFLLNNGAKVNLLDMYGKSMIYLACYNNISPLHDGNLPEKVVLSTSFDFYERNWGKPSEEFLELSYDLEYRFFNNSHMCFQCLKMLLNAGADPKLFPTDDLACSSFTVIAKMRAYLMLAGAMLNPEDIWITAIEPGPASWQVWLKSQLKDQLSLTRQCRYVIRMCVAHTRDVDKAVSELPLPSALKAKLKLDDDFEDFMKTVGKSETD